MRRSERSRKPVVHYGEVESYSAEENSDDEHYGDGEYMPPRILPTRSCNLRTQQMNEYSNFSVGSKFSREKRDVLKQIDIKFKFESYSDLRELLLKLLEEICAHESAGPFLEPVPKDVPYYYTFILDPMDLSTIRSKVQDFTYSTEESYFEDLVLMFENCKTFNEPGTEVFKAGVNLRKFVTKIKKTHFPDFEDIQPDSIIIDRITREKQELDSTGKPVTEHTINEEKKTEVVVKKEEKLVNQDKRFLIEEIYPKYIYDAPLSSTTFHSNPDLIEVAVFLWLLGRTDNFSVVGNQNFTLSALERAYLVPHQSSLFLSLNFLLVSKITGVRRMRQIFSIAPQDVTGYTDVVDVKVLSSDYHIGKLLVKIYDILLLWNSSRNSFRKELDSIQAGTQEAGLSRQEQFRIELDFYNELLFSLSPWNDFKDFCALTEVSVVPFHNINDFIALSPGMRLKITKALISWRLVGYQDLNISNALRLLDADILNQTPVGKDTQGVKYFYFPQFFKECRLYRMYPSLEQQFLFFQKEKDSFESIKSLSSLIKTFSKLKSRKYVEASDKVYDLRELKGKFKRKLTRRETSAHFSGLCQELVVFLTKFFSTGKDLSSSNAQGDISPCMYSSVVEFIRPLLPVNNTSALSSTSKEKDALPEVEISDSEASDKDAQSTVSESDASETKNLKRKRTESFEMSDEEISQNGKEAKSGDSESPEMEDIIFDGSDYIPIRRSNRARKSVKRLEMNYDDDKKKRKLASRRNVKLAKSRKIKKIKKSINSAKPGEMVKSEVSEIESFISALEQDPFEAFLSKSYVNLLPAYHTLVKDFSSNKTPFEGDIRWELQCKNPDEVNDFIAELESTSFKKKFNRRLIQKLQDIRETSTELLMEQARMVEQEEKKQLKDIEIQNASRKRSNRIQQEQEKMNKIREAQEFERMREIRHECAGALWKDYRKKRKKQLDRERRVLRIEYQRAIERERQERLELNRQQEEFERQARLEKIRLQVKAKQEAYRRHKQLELENYKRNQEIKAARQNQYLTQNQTGQYGYSQQVQHQALQQQQIAAQLQHRSLNGYGIRGMQQNQNFISSPRQQAYSSPYQIPGQLQGYRVPTPSLGFQNIGNQSQTLYSNQLLQQQQQQHLQQRAGLTSPAMLQTYQNLQQFQKNNGTPNKWTNDVHRTNSNQDTDRFY